MSTQFLPMRISCEGTICYFRNTSGSDEEKVRRIMMSFPDMELRIALMLIKHEADVVDIPNTSECNIVIHPWFVTYTGKFATAFYGPFETKEKADDYITAKGGDKFSKHMLYPGKQITSGDNTNDIERDGETTSINM